MKKRSEHGSVFVAALTIIVAGFLFYGMAYVTIAKGNFWYTDAGAFRQLQAEHPQVTELVKTERSVFDYSRITVREGDAQKTYLLNTNILFNYSFSEAD